MIGVFDSGIGGVTILKQLIKDHPDYHYFYYSDSIHNPYGDKKEEEVKEITKKIVEELKAKGCKIIVIACNTASTIAVEYLREQFPEISFIATVPAIKVAHDFYPNSDTLVMATEGTLHSDLWKELYDQYRNPHSDVLICEGLANLIEEGKKEEIKTYLETYLTPYKGTETVILGCTHYPLIKKEIQEVLGPVRFCESKEGISRRLGVLLERYHIPKQKSSISFYDSSYSKQKEERFWDFLGFDKI